MCWHLQTQSWTFKSRTTQFFFASLKSKETQVLFFTGLTCALFNWALETIKDNVKIVRDSLTREDHWTSHTYEAELDGNTHVSSSDGLICKTLCHHCSLSDHYGSCKDTWSPQTFYHSSWASVQLKVELPTAWSQTERKNNTDITPKFFGKNVLIQSELTFFVALFFLLVKKIYSLFLFSF